MTNENPNEQNENLRFKRFREAFSWAFAGMISSRTGDNSKEPYTRSEETFVADTANLHQMELDGRASEGQPAQNNMVVPAQLSPSYRDQLDIAWLQGNERTGSEIEQAIPQPKSGPES